MVVVKTYKLVCGPNSQGIEDEVNKILVENPGAQFNFFTPVCGPYYKRHLEMDCLTCGLPILEIYGEYQCKGCKRIYTAEEFQNRAHTNFSQAGTLFLQPLLIESDKPMKNRQNEGI